ncbi:ABC transporter ATP-binding protein [Propionivibrio soli]|uniref:ABC transporter ATP-binding protein n=1 Tax=Propionivibrio soli TaxID=2976531 RepID=UPI0021E82E8A|nr:ABC transporter ATP-binding protein [Propionivibrio soli]
MLVLKRSSIEAKGVSLSHGDKRILSGIDLRIESGEFFCILGPSGAGKTTFLRVVAGLETPDSGELLIDGDPVSSKPPQKRGVGMVFQSLGLWPHMTVYETVSYGLVRQGVPEADIRRKVDFMLKLVGLDELAQRYPGELSGGQQQKVAIARALVVEPRILLLDQPMSALDQPFRIHLRRDIQSLQRKLGITTIMVTHDPEEALSVADRIAVIRDGRIQQIGSPPALYDYPFDTFVANSVGTANLIAGSIEEDEAGAACFYSDATGSVPLLDRLRVPAPGRAYACFRPSSVHVAPYDSSAHDADYLWMNGRIFRSEFRGGYLRYSVGVGDETVVCDLPHRTATLPMPVGSEVLLGIEISQIRFVNA